jgi:hypothetical protein
LRERLTVIEGVLENSFSSFFAIFFLLCLSCRDKERKRESQTESEKESLERNFYLSKLLAEWERERDRILFVDSVTSRERRRGEFVFWETAFMVFLL